MTIQKLIDFYERYLDIDDDMREMFQELGIPLTLNYKYKQVKYPVDEITNVLDIEGCPSECVVVFKDGFKIIVLGDPDETYIRINDFLNSNLEAEEN